MESSASWAAQLLPLAPTRQVADALFAQINDSDLYRIVEYPVCGLTLPRQKLSVERAMAHATAAREAADIERLSRDSRKGVRRTLARNPLADPAWSSTMLETAVEASDWDSVNAALHTAEFSSVLGLLRNTEWARHTLPYYVKNPVLVHRIRTASTIDRIEVAQLVATEKPFPNAVGVLGNYRLSAPQIYVDGLSAGDDLRVVAAAVPDAAPAVLWMALSSRHVDRELAEVAVEHAEGIQALVERYMATKSFENHFSRFGLGGQTVDVDAADVLAACTSPFVQSVAALSSKVSASQVDDLIDNCGAVTLSSLAYNPSICPDASYINRVWQTEDESSRYRFSPDQCARLTDALLRHRIDGEALALLLGSGHPFTADDVALLVRHGSTRHIEEWLTGKYEGHLPYPGQVTAFWESLGEKTPAPETVADLAVKALRAGFAHAEELLVQSLRVPVLVGQRSNFPQELLQRVAAEAVPILGHDPEAWVTLTTIAPRFGGTVQELAATAVAVSA